MELTNVIFLANRILVGSDEDKLLIDLRTRRLQIYVELHNSGCHTLVSSGYHRFLLPVTINDL